MFDFDGTLVDTAPDIVKATNQLLIKHNHQPLAPEVIRKDIGTGLKNLLLDFFPEAASSPEREQRLTEEFLEIYRSVFLESPKLFPGALEFLTDHAPSENLRIAIVSNKREELIHPILESLNLHQLPWVRIIGGDTFETMKPHKTPLLAAINAAQAQPHEAVIVGDGSPDIEGALAAECFSVAVSFGYTSIQDLMNLGAHGRIDHFNELLTLLKLGFDDPVIDTPHS